MTKRRNFSDQFKAAVALEAQRSDKTVQEIAAKRQTWLSENEYVRIEVEWQEQLELREELKDKPSGLKRYEEKLWDATFEYNRTEGYSGKDKNPAAKTFYNKS